MSKTIVMIHGMSCSSWCWDFFRLYFEKKGYECHTPILRHHDVDPSAKPPLALGTTSIRDYVSDLEAYIARLDEKPILIGHSMGGLLVQVLLSKGLGEKGILLSPAPPWGTNAFTWSIFKFTSLFFGAWPLWKNSFRINFKLAVYAFLHLTPKTEQKKIYDQLVHESGRAASEIALWIFDSKKSSRVDQSKIQCPMLTIAAAQDRIIPTSVVKKIHKKYQNRSDYKEFKNNSHWLIGEEGWENVAEYIAKWLEGKN